MHVTAPNARRSVPPPVLALSGLAALALALYAAISARESIAAAIAGAGGLILLRAAVRIYRWTRCRWL